MPFSNNFPYTDLHDINLNKFLKAIKNLLGGHGGEFLKKKSNIPFDYAWEPVEVDIPVQSVNGQTGAVVLDAEDVGALPDTYTAPVQSVNGQTGAVVLDAEDVGALPDDTVIPNDKVEQTATTTSGYTYWRPLIVGQSSNSSENGAFSTVTDKVRTFDNIRVQPSTGTVKASIFKGDLTGTASGNLPNSTKYAESNSVAGPAKKTETIPYGECDSTSTATAYTATVPGITELKNGTIMLLKNGVVTSASGFTININGLGAKPSYSNMATGNDITPTAPTRDTTIFNINYTMMFIYDETLVSGGCWIGYRGYDSNTNTIGYQLRTNSSTMPVSGALYRYRLLFTSLNGRNWIPANTTNSTSADTTKTTNTATIDPFGAIVYYGSTTTVSSGSRPSSTVLWQEYTLNIGYSFNTTGSAPTLTSYRPVYLKCSPQSAGGAKISSTPYVQTLPSSADNHIYIFLGMAYNATNIELSMVHPVYYHDGTSINIWTGKNTASTNDIANIETELQSSKTELQNQIFVGAPAFTARVSTGTQLLNSFWVNKCCSSCGFTNSGTSVIIYFVLGSIPPSGGSQKTYILFQKNSANPAYEFTYENAPTKAEMSGGGTNFYKYRLAVTGITSCLDCRLCRIIYDANNNEVERIYSSQYRYNMNNNVCTRTLVSTEQTSPEHIIDIGLIEPTTSFNQTFNAITTAENYTILPLVSTDQGTTWTFIIPDSMFATATYGLTIALRTGTEKLYLGPTFSQAQ